MLVYSPIILILAVWMGLIYAYFFLLIATLTPVFQENYPFTDSTVGLSYLGLAVGFELGQVFFASVSDKLVKQLAKKTASGEMKPKYRLLPSVVGGITTPVALLWYGWSAQARVHWMVPIIGSTFLGIGNSLIFVSSSILTPWVYC
jgi:MFS family permease